MSYARGRLHTSVFKGLNVAVQDGDHIGIRGGNGAGKSTFMKMCVGLQPPDQGTVLVAGRDLYELSDRDRTQLRKEMIGFVSPSRRHRSGPQKVVEHVAEPLIGSRWNPNQADGMARDTLHRVGASRCLDAFMNELSPGEETQVALARALIREPQLVLVDEPESVPSPDERTAIRDFLRNLGREAGITLVVASASPGAVRSARRFYSISNGRLLEERSEHDEHGPAEVLPFRSAASGSGSDS